MESENRVGEIVLLSFPYTDYKNSKVRPGLILSDKNQGEDYIVAYITTENDAYAMSDYAVMFDRNDLASGFIRSQSTIRVDKNIPVHKTQIRRFGLGTLGEKKLQSVLHAWAHLVTNNFYSSVHLPEKTEEFIPGKSRINYAGRVFDEKEMFNLVDSSLEFWLTYGRYKKEFEKKLVEYLGARYVLFVNSGSSANLLAFMALTSPLLKDRQIRRGDEVITVAAGFPTTVAPVIQYGAIPVFADIDV